MILKELNEIKTISHYYFVEKNNMIACVVNYMNYDQEFYCGENREQAYRRAQVDNN